MTDPLLNITLRRSDGSLRVQTEDKTVDYQKDEVDELRAALNYEVIKELEARKRNLDDVKADLPISSESYGQLRIALHAFDVAIKLIKEGIPTHQSVPGTVIPPTEPSLQEKIDLEAQSCHNCDNCTPLGQQKKYGVHDGRHDTKPDCCKSRRSRPYGCPVATRVTQAHLLAIHDALTRRDERVNVCVQLEEIIRILKEPPK
jgi:hypothetical protein